MKALQYDEKDLMWLLTAVEDDITLWLQLKSQHNSDLYFVELDIMNWVKIQIKLSEIRRIFHYSCNHAALLSLNDQMDNLSKLEQSITVTINKVGALF